VASILLQFLTENMKKLSFILLIIFSPLLPKADAKGVDSLQVSNYAHFYVSSGMEGSIFSTAQVTRPEGLGTATHLSTLRYSLFVNTGISLNWNLSQHFGVFTGLQLKNIGFIEQLGDYTIKRRVYTIGAPIGFRVGNMEEHGGSIFLGGGLDLPFNYKEKKFIARNNKDKFNEWFSKRTPAAMPYVFVGYSFPNQLTLRLQYYPGNFLNPDYRDSRQLQPNAGYEVHLVNLGVGYNIRYGKYTRFKGKWMRHSMI
jgi:hypothetical protein